MIADAEGRELRAGDGARVVLAALIKSGGAGSVYRVQGQPLLVAKLYHDSVDLPQYERKVAAMLALTPDLPELSEGGTRYVQIAWPKALLRDARGRFVGYLMPAVDVAATSELECVMQEKQARALGLPTGLGAKVTLAANLANVIAELHRQQHRVVDLKPVNLRFYPKSLYMAMLDCDGFSIQGKGERFEAPQVTVDYLAPEFQRGGLSASGEEAQDRFALAVIVFQLLNFGIHPFTGRPANDRVPTDVPSRIAARLYAYGLKPNAQLAPNPVSGHAAMPADLRQLFDRAFDGAGVARPSAIEWGAALRPYAQRASLKLVKCGSDGEHQHFAGLPCAACARAALISRTAKGSGRPLPVAPGKATATPATRGSAGARSGFHWSKPKRWRVPPIARQPAVFSGGGGAPPPAPARNWPMPASNWPPPAPNWPPPIPYPAWAAGPLRRWLYAQYYNAAPEQLAKLLIFLAIMIVGVIANLYEQSNLRVFGRNPDPVAPSAVAESPPPPPAPPPSALLQPIAVDVPTPGFYQGAVPSVGQIADTGVIARRAALALADNDIDRADLATATLQRRVTHDARIAPRSALLGAEEFRDFAVRALTLSPENHGAEFARLDAALRTNPYDVGAVCEWSWLALLDGREEFASNGFLRAIWTDPAESCGWLGLGSTSSDNATTYGALLEAERLATVERPDYESAALLLSAAHPNQPGRTQTWRSLAERARAEAQAERGHKR